MTGEPRTGTPLPTTREGLVLRPLDGLADRERLRDLCPRLSARTRLLRFHGGVKELSDPFLDHLLNVDHHRREALVVLDSNAIIAVARYAVACEESQEAEVSILVADDWQHQGIAQRLICDLRALAVQRGIRTFTATVQPHNDQARRFISTIAPHHRVLTNEGDLAYRWDCSREAGLVDGPCP
ncbi:GNAT family N-acetyltransferase [Streptomyces sp. NBC_01515]|uniref:GNAT family N-acetyltransferase n=1 Tax=Streptomyces sp. NBC_01515 TaxID=2903890 RepID=UPI0038657720